jgi:dihydroneopterin aldolase
MTGEVRSDVTSGAADRVELRGLKTWGHHGVFDYERVEGQDFVVDVVLYFDTRPAAASDELSDTVNYAAVAQVVTSIVGGEPVKLIETLAGRIADACLAEPRVDSVEVSVHKPHAPIPLPFGDVVVTIRRTRGES